MSHEILDYSVSQQLYSSATSTSAAPVISLRRRLLCLVVLFVVGAVGSLWPSWAFFAPFREELIAAKKQESNTGVRLPVVDVAVATTPTTTTPALSTQPHHDSDHATMPRFSSFSQHSSRSPSQRLCVASLFLAHNELLASEHLEWAYRTHRRGSDVVFVDGDATTASSSSSSKNGSYVPEVVAPIPRWRQPTTTSTAALLELFSSRFGRGCSGANSPPKELVQELQADLLRRQRRRFAASQERAVLEDSIEKSPSPPSTTFSRDLAWQYLSGKRLLFIGSSNTRTLMTNVQARLEGTPQMSRVSAKQLCDDNEKNHSCSVVVVPPLQSSSSSSSSLKPVRLHYVGYKEDLFDASLKSRVDNVFFTARDVDVVVMSTGINSIQKNPNWHLGRNKKMRQLKDWIEKTVFGGVSSPSSSSSSPLFVWHSVSPLCKNMPHFRRYRFKKGAWSGQTVEAVNVGLRQMNAQVSMGSVQPSAAAAADGGGSQALKSPRKFASSSKVPGGGGGLEWSERVRHIDVDALLEKIPVGSVGGENQSTYYATYAPFIKPNTPYYCRFYEDPLHHRFLDRAIVDVFMSHLL